MFGKTGLLSFGQGAFYGTGGFVTAYLLTSGTLDNAWLAMLIGIAAAAAFSVVVGFLALRRVGIYFAMVPWRSASCRTFWRIRCSDVDGRRKRFAGETAPVIRIDGLAYTFAGSWPSYQLVAGFYFIGFALARFI